MQRNQVILTIFRGMWQADGVLIHVLGCKQHDHAIMMRGENGTVEIFDLLMTMSNTRYLLAPMTNANYIHNSCFITITIPERLTVPVPLFYIAPYFFSTWTLSFCLLSEEGMLSSSSNTLESLF